MKVFIAGGISSCPDWQKTAMEKLSVACPSITLYNPRQANFDITNPDCSKRQIDWEYNHLMQSNVIMFWFPSESICPIALFELGAYARDPTKKIFIGCALEYTRRFDVEEQMKHHNPSVSICDDLDVLCKQVAAYCCPSRGGGERE